MSSLSNSFYSPANCSAASSYKEPLITIYTAVNNNNLQGRCVTSNDVLQMRNVDEIFLKVLKRVKLICKFWYENFGLCSFDGNGTEVRVVLHDKEDPTNASWCRNKITIGNGDSCHQKLSRLSIIAHEFGHGVTGDRLNYYGEAGALNEHLSDVWGALAEQYYKKQTTSDATWLIGKDVLIKGNHTYPLRSMEFPGTAYDDDLQCSHYSNLYKGEYDNGGVHYNSGIPNKAFCLFAMAQGGNAWEKAGHLWYKTFKNEDLVKPDCTIHQFAHATILTAFEYYPGDSQMRENLIQAWKEVGIAYKPEEK